jgi:hypothetical protein
MTKDQIEALRTFAKTVIRASWEGCDYGDDIQEAAEAGGLIVKVTCTEGNRRVWEEIDGMEDAKPGDHFFQLAPWLKGKT